MTGKVRKQIHVGQGGALYAMVATMILVVAVYTQNNLLFWGFGLMAGGLLVSLLIALTALRGVTIERVPPTHGVVGEMMVLRYRVSNRKRWLPVFGLMIEEEWSERRSVKREVRDVKSEERESDWLFAWLFRRRKRKTERTGEHRSSAHTWLMHLGPGQCLQAEAPCWPTCRGTLRLGKVVVSTSFPFGILNAVALYEMPGSVLVYPRLWRIQRQTLHRLFNSDTFGQRRIERAGGHEDFFGLRPYRPGDSLKMIDWRRTARTGELISREMTLPSPPRVMILLDLRGSADIVPQLERKTETSAGKTGAMLDINKYMAGSSRAIKSLLGLKTNRTIFPPDQSDANQSNVSTDTQAALDSWAAADPVEAAISLAASLVCEAHLNGCQIGLVILGAASASYPVHHSLPHRTRMLESLSLLDPRREATEMPALWTEPTVVIQPTEQTGGAPLLRARRAEIWHATRLSSYAAPARGAHIEALLGHRLGAATRRTRRAMLQGADSWN